MVCSYRIIRKNEHKTNYWSGGVTTELAIYPENAVYADRNFLWRVSSASVEAESSVFTSLPGYWRYLMILSGAMTLEHEGHHTVPLKPLEQDSFSGSWVTRSKGKAVDMNLMVAEGCKGELQSVCLSTGQHYDSTGASQHSDYEYVSEMFYCIEGGFDAVIDDGETVHVGEGDLMTFEKKASLQTAGYRFVNREESNALMIQITVFYPSFS